MTHWTKGLFFMRPALPGSISPKITVIECIENTLEWTCHSPLHYSLKICVETSPLGRKKVFHTNKLPLNYKNSTGVAGFE